MLCERCKIREANIKYTEIINGVKTEHNLCSHCAREMDFGQYMAFIDGDFPLGRLLSGLLGLADDEEETEVRGRVVCPTCGTSFDDFVENSRFGCPDCYEVFDLLISDKIRQLQGSDRHKGKKPKNAGKPAEKVVTAREAAPESAGDCSLEEQIARLYACQQEAVKREDYEEAARLRDEIRRLKTGSETDA